MKMFIPTRGRWDNQLTKSWADSLFDVRLVVRDDEYAEYKRVHPAKKIIVVPKTADNIGKIRDFILEQASGRFVMADDILRVKPSIRAIPPNGELTAFVDEVEKGLDEFALLGPTSTFTDGFTKKGSPPGIRTGNVMNVFCINKKLLPKEVHFYFGGYGTWEDGFFNLCAALHCVRPMTFRHWVFAKKFWAPGGCTSMGRTAKVVTEDTLLMYSLHPAFVRLKTVIQPSGEQSLYAILMLNKAYKYAMARKAEK